MQSTSKPYSRTFLRMGAREGMKGILGHLNWTEAYLWLQILWNGPVRPSKLFGVPDARYQKKCLAKLLKRGWVAKSVDGYSVRDVKIKDEADTTYIWLWPLRFGHISMQARVLLCLIDEYTGGRNYTNRSQLSKVMGVGRTTLYKYLDELEQEGLVLQWGGKHSRKLVCFRHLGKVRDEVIKGILDNEKYIRSEDGELDDGVSSRTPQCLPANNQVSSGEHTDSPLDSLKGSPPKAASKPKAEYEEAVCDAILGTAKRNGADFADRDLVVKHVKKGFGPALALLDRTSKLVLIHNLLQDSSTFMVLPYIGYKVGIEGCGLANAIESVIRSYEPDADGFIYWDDGMLPGIEESLAESEVGRRVLSLLEVKSDAA